MDSSGPSRRLVMREEARRFEGHKKLALLHQKLALTTFPDELEDTGWKYGAPLADVRRLVERWGNCDVDRHGTSNIHYVHMKSAVAGAIPLLVVHGWPGSFLEVRKLAPLLIEGTTDLPAFHLVALSVPGYGFSQRPSTKGFDFDQYAEVIGNRSLALRTSRIIFRTPQITSRMAKLYGGTHIKAWHAAVMAHLRKTEKERLAKNALFLSRGLGYARQQSTQPQTLGYSLADSPVGLLAWIYEKLVRWADEYPWTDDEANAGVVLTWVSIYWFSRAGPTASLRVSFEGANRNFDAMFAVSRPPPTIPLGISHFPKDVLVFPRRCVSISHTFPELNHAIEYCIKCVSWTRVIGNIVFDGEHESGGHFAAYEKPEELVDDLRKMFGKGGLTFGVVDGRSGYMCRCSLSTCTGF
ncbi:Alpha/Beta hydrolase protein [Mycena maculata]|uniref:Alpha/Beta hydrolase protein n=1 Tax=Mycena maculata TaxID=230809 RepID=A0AAD7NXB2_9AGAR|nr:Alpha/Beta hydrolase protein [Mycena maculata]